jgi:hypothetical protein
LRSTLVKGSKTEYETKKMVSDALYWAFVIPRSFWRPTIFAFPIFVLYTSQFATLSSERSIFHG